MNRRLLDPFQAVELPEVIEEYLENGTTRCIAFNRRGTLLAAGTEEGQIVIWDFDTRGVAKVYDGHSKPVTCLCWSRNGRQLLSGSQDQTVILWNVLDGSKECCVDVGAPVIHVGLSRFEPYFGLISLQFGEALWLDLKAQQLQPLPYITLDHDGSGSSKGAARSDAPVASKHVVAIFNKKSDTIICGQAKGIVVFMNATNKRILDVIRIPNAPRVSGLILNRKGKYLLLNCHDRVIRLLELQPLDRLKHAGYTQEELPHALATSKTPIGPVPNSALWPKEQSLMSPVHSFQNVVDRTQWRSACFSGDSEHVIGAAFKKDSHHIYIWNRFYGKLERILEGPRGEGIGEVAWHPTRSILTSVTPQGRIYLWAKIYNENWSAFAPDFKELDENKEYVEREDEFDNNDQETTENGEVVEGVDEEDVDIMKAEKVEVLSSDGEDDSQQLHYLPVTIEKGMDVEEDAAVRLDGSAPGVGLSRLDSGQVGTQGEDFADGDADGDETGLGQRKRRVRWEQDWSDMPKRTRKL